MTTTFTCQSCGQEKPANYRLKEQEYCGEAACQREGKRIWQKQKMATDPHYRANQLKNLQTWRQNRPLHQYQRQYRQNHPEYVQINREKQRARNRKRRAKNETGRHHEIVKMDSCSRIKSGIYRLTPCEMDTSGMIVKMETCLAELIVLVQDRQPTSPVVS